MCSLIHKIMPVWFIFPTSTFEQVFGRVPFGQNRSFPKKLSLGTAFPSQLRANNLVTFVEGRTSQADRSYDLDLWRNAFPFFRLFIFGQNASILWKSSRIFFRAKVTEHFLEQVSTMALYYKKIRRSCFYSFF